MIECREWMLQNATGSSVQLIDCMGSDRSVVNSARVSYASDELNKEHLDERDKKLINFLAENKHTSPFNHAFVSFKIEAPIFVARQLVKHEYLVWNEISRRYTEKDLKFFNVQGWGKQDEKNKQGTGEPLREKDQWLCTEAYQNLVYTAYTCYKSLLATGVSKEDARMVLPQSSMTEWYWSGSLGAFAKMCKLRLDNHTQHYTREIAEAISTHMEWKFPVSWQALIKENNI
tara:strand:+ start:1741 stop:2433 length:693 start_codon:yes stop_codon:yes gene_type:complete